MPTIYDNIEEFLSDEINKTLQESYRADFCVGYFNLRGWKIVADAVDRFSGSDENCCRLIVGMQRPSEEILKQVLSNQNTGLVDQAKVVALKKAMAHDFKTQLTFGIPKADDEKALQMLSQQLKDKKVRVKLFLSHSLHAKLYLTFRRERKTPVIGYIGSSNLTMSGLKIRVNSMLMLLTILR